MRDGYLKHQVPFPASLIPWKLIKHHSCEDWLTGRLESSKKKSWFKMLLSLSRFPSRESMNLLALGLEVLGSNPTSETTFVTMEKSQPPWASISPSENMEVGLMAPEVPLALDQ